MLVGTLIGAAFGAAFSLLGTMFLLLEMLLVTLLGAAFSLLGMLLGKKSIGVVDRAILADSSSYSLTRPRACCRSLILYQALYLRSYSFYLIKYLVEKPRPFLVIRLFNKRLIFKLINSFLLIDIGGICLGLRR